MDLRHSCDRRRLHLGELQSRTARWICIRGSRHLHAFPGAMECEHSVADDPREFFMDLPHSSPRGQVACRDSDEDGQACSRSPVPSTELRILQSAGTYVALRLLADSLAVAVCWDVARANCHLSALSCLEMGGIH